MPRGDSSQLSASRSYISRATDSSCINESRSPPSSCHSTMQYMTWTEYPVSVDGWSLSNAVACNSVPKPSGDIHIAGVVEGWQQQITTGRRKTTLALHSAYRDKPHGLTDLILVVNYAQMFNHVSRIGERRCPKVVLAELAKRDCHNRHHRKRDHPLLSHPPLIHLLLPNR